MRKYRNGKKSQRLKGDKKYSESYLEYSHARGSKSVKVLPFDADGNGSDDTILKAWRHPAVRKGNYLENDSVTYPTQSPTGISVLSSPQTAPTNISAVISPQSAPTNISAVISPQSAPTGIVVTTNPQFAPTGISTTINPSSGSNYITFEGQTYNLVESSSTITITTSGTSEYAIRQDDTDETLIPISANSTWSGNTDGPIITVTDSNPSAHYAKIDTTEGNTYIVDRQSSLFSNGQATGTFASKWTVHTNNLISGSTTRSKAILRLRWMTLSNTVIKTEYFKIGFEQN